MSSDAKREALRQRVEAAQARFQDRPPEQIVADAAKEGFNYAKQNPLIAVGGVAAAALAIGLFIKRSKKSGASNELLTRFITDVAIGFAFRLFEKQDREPDEFHNTSSQDLIGEGARDESQ